MIRLRFQFTGQREWVYHLALFHAKNKCFEINFRSGHSKATQKHDDNLAQGPIVRTENHVIEQPVILHMEASAVMTKDSKNENTSLDTETQMECGKLLTYVILNREFPTFSPQF